MHAHIYRNPIKYSKNNNLQYSFAKKHLNKIKIKKNDRILDIGSGDGRITKELADMATDGCVIGTDISHEMVKYANNTYGSQKNLKFIQMDASENIFRDQFDVITSFNCLHWVKDQESAIMGISNSAKEDAIIAILLSHKKSLIHNIIENVCSSAKWKEYFIGYNNPRSFFELNNYKKLLKNHGLNIINIDEEEMTFSHDSEEKLKEYLISSISQVKQIPKSSQNEFISDISKEFLENSKVNDDGSIPISYWCLNIISNKKSLQNENKNFLEKSMFAKL